MKHIVIIFLLGTFTFLGQSKIDRDLGDFSKVAVYDGINLELVKSDENKVEITGKNTNFVVVKNKNGDLKIRLNLERRFFLFCLYTVRGRVFAYARRFL